MLYMMFLKSDFNKLCFKQLGDMKFAFFHRVIQIYLKIYRVKRHERQNLADTGAYYNKTDKL